jgi:hypothetical protein
MELIEKLVRFFKGALRKSSAPDNDMIRQNSPPDERDVDAAEQDSDGDSKIPGSRLVGDKSEPRKAKSRAKKAGGNS